MLKGVIFDLDGVLVSTDELHYKAWKKLADRLNIYNFTKEDNEMQRGVSRMESLEIILQKTEEVFDDLTKEKLADEKNDYYKEYLKELNEEAVLPGAIATLKMLKLKKMIIGIGSASKNTPQILVQTGLKPYIDQVSCGLDITRSKPDPEVFLVAAKKMMLYPKECLVVEDSLAGVIAATAAGMKSLGVGPFYQNLKADYFAKNLTSKIEWDQIIEQL